MILATSRSSGRTLDVERISRAGLVAAARWLDELKKRPYESTAQTLRSAPQYRGLTPTQYRVSFDWLVSVGLVTADGEVAVPFDDPRAAVLESYLGADPPGWFGDAGDLVGAPSDVPLDVVAIATDLGLDDSTAFLAVRRAWTKYDDTRQREVGLAGEIALIEWLQAQYACSVVQLSSVDDSAGYDLIVSERLVAHVEVKSTYKTDEPIVFLSRNEYQVMLHDPHWCLQVVRLSPSNNSLQALGWVANEDLVSWAPTDTGPGEWQSFKARIPASALRRGMSPILESATSSTAN